MRARSPEGVCSVCVCGGCGVRKERERRAARCRHVACGSRCRWDRHRWDMGASRPGSRREVECFENALHHIEATARRIVAPLFCIFVAVLDRISGNGSRQPQVYTGLYFIYLNLLCPRYPYRVPSSYVLALAHFVCVCSLVIMVTGPTLESLRHVGFAARNDVLCQNLPVWPRTSPQECRASYRSVGGLV
jgi:hypothetical protein